jgi:hypothetical protein
MATEQRRVQRQYENMLTGGNRPLHRDAEVGGFALTAVCLAEIATLPLLGLNESYAQRPLQQSAAAPADLLNLSCLSLEGWF